jgi:probable addiction module antidote protein
LNAALDDSEEMLLVALRNVAEARQMSKVAEGAGVNRESLYRMLSETGNPTYSSLTGVLNTLGLKLSIEPVQALGGSTTSLESLMLETPKAIPQQSPQYQTGVSGGPSAAHLLLGPTYENIGIDWKSVLVLHAGPFHEDASYQRQLKAKRNENQLESAA